MAVRRANSASETRRSWLTPDVFGIGLASFLADAGHETPTALLPSFLTATLGAPAAALSVMEGLADGAAGRCSPARWNSGRRKAGFGRTDVRQNLSCLPGRPLSTRASVGLGGPSKGSSSLDPVPSVLGLLWLQDCDRFALGASQSDQHVDETVDSKQLAESHALIRPCRDGNHLALRDHEKGRPSGPRSGRSTDSGDGSCARGSNQPRLRPIVGQPSARSRRLSFGEVQRTGQNCRFLEGDPTTSDETLCLSKFKRVG
jgi:hypothetical protein